MTDPAGQTDPAILYRPWLHRWALALVVATFLLIAIGGNVTSLGAGLSVPDGFTTFGYFPITAPLEVWWHDLGTRWEHSHRLKGYVVGTLMIVLAGWLWRTQRPRPWLRWLGVGMLGLVIVQGVMGALRVSELSLTLAIIHGITGQLFLTLTVLAAAATSRLWIETVNQRRSNTPAESSLNVPRALPRLGLVLLGVLVVQLVLGAWMRHHGAGLAIPDFPTSYGQVLPPLNQTSLDLAAASYPGPVRPTTVSHVAVHFAHRAWAVAVLGVAIWLVVWLNLVAAGHRLTAWPARWLMLLLGVQVLLGASVIWTGRYPEVATAHQAVGAAVLAVAAWLTIRLHLLHRAEPGVGSSVQQDRRPSVAEDAPPRPRVVGV